MRKTTYFMAVMLVTIQIVSHMIVHFAGADTVEQQIRATNYYMLCDAICWVLAFCIITMLATGLFRQLMSMCIFLWVGKVIDELFFDPTVLTWNDLVLFNIAQLVAVYAITKHITRK